ncbi:hypothetical protein AB0M95_29810 [Sphaerisporangium sp. NPDC051017]|uniref:hypothetical protein n=1 Tax=Sphaerisporangium sp. NPDC051017 TaxID=3154636 RepID=UPI00343678F3
MTKPAERYAAFRDKHAGSGPALTSFRGLYDFELDEFQLDACRALEAGDGVLVAAPTGSGTTVRLRRPEIVGMSASHTKTYEVVTAR